jgi:hypothetical protein
MAIDRDADSLIQNIGVLQTSIERIKELGDSVRDLRKLLIDCRHVIRQSKGYDELVKRIDLKIGEVTV